MGKRTELASKIFTTIRGLVSDIVSHLLDLYVPKEYISIDLGRSDDGMIIEGFIEVQFGNGLKYKDSQVAEIRIYDSDNFQLLLPSKIAKEFGKNNISFNNISDLTGILTTITEL